jgi:cardiolipin synthase
MDPGRLHERKSKVLPVRTKTAIAGGAVALLASACVSRPTPPASAPAPTAVATTATTATRAVAPSPTDAPTTGAAPVAAGDQLVILPDQGIQPIYSFLSSPARTLDMTMYELVDVRAEQILAADAARGVDVRVVLDRNLEGTANQDAFNYLGAHGVHVVWAPASYDSTHEKAVVVDDRTALIMTLNLTSRYYSDTRDFAVVDDDRGDVAAVETVFGADFVGQAVIPPAGGDLVWSPGSAPALTDLIDGATTSLLVESEEMSSTLVVRALQRAAARGVHVTVVMTDQGRYDRELSELRSAGVDVRLRADSDATLYIHAKVVVADGNEAFVGSENFSTASLDYNRELGLVTRNSAVVAALARTVSADAG